MADDGPVVEFSALEREKENITVNRDGHSAVALQQTFSVPRNQRQQQLAAEKARFTQLIKDAHDDSPDPLDAYVQFVKWTIDSYPAGKSADSGLVPLLELATRTFKDDPSYKLDLRYLNLWLQYANVVAKPELIYAYLLANDIGHCFAVLYEEYANVLERQGNRTKADEIYRLGVARKAKPFSVLKTRYDEFLARMLTAPAGGGPEPEPEGSSSAPALGGRKVLGDRATGGRSQPGGPSQTPVAAPTPKPSSSSNRGKISVFVDDGASQGESQYAMNEWTKLDSQAAIDKENHSEPTPWTGERLHQAVPKTPRTPRFTVLKDMDSADLAKPIPHKTPDTMVIRPPTQRPPTEAEMLFLDPFKNYTHPPSQPSDVSTKPAVFQPSVPEPSTSKAGVASSSKAPSHSAPPTTRPSASDPSKYPKPRAFIPHEELPGQAPRRPEKLGFNFKLLWNEADQKEFCAYEARAKTLGLLYKKWPAPEIPTQGHVSFQLPKTGEGSRKNRMSVAREPTVTINTKFAMNDVLDMFNGMDGEEEDSFEDDGGGNAGPSGGAAQGLATAPAQIPPTPTPLSRATSASLVDKTPISKPKVSQTPKFTPFVDAADDGATKPGVSSLAGVGHPSSHTPGPLGRSVSVPSVLGQSTTRTPRFTPFVDPPSATPRPPLVAKTPSALSSATPLGPPPTVAPPEGAPEPTPLRPRPGPSFRPFVDSGGDVPPTPTPLSSTRTTDEPLDLPSSIREEEMSGEGQTSGSGEVGLKSFGIFRDVSPKQNDPIVQHTSPKVQTSPQPPFSIDNIFSSSTSGIFDNVKDEPAKEPSEQQSFPLINFVPSPENTQEHTQPVVPPRAYEDDLKSVFGPPMVAPPPEAQDGDSDWSSEDQVQDQPQEVAGEDGTDSEGADQEDSHGYRRLGRFPSIDQMTPITERTYEYTRTSSDLAAWMRRPSAADSGTDLGSGPSNPGLSTIADEAEYEPVRGPRPRESLGRPRQSLVSQDDEGGVPNPCNPFVDDVMRQLLAAIPVPFFDYRDQTCGQLDRLRRFGAKKQRTSSQNRRTSASVETLSLTLAEDKFEIYEKLGEGGFGAVFLARCGGGATDEVDEDAFLALKAVKPCQLWEWTILVRLRECMPPETLPSIITPQALYAFSDESYLLLDHCRHGTLLDCVNKASGTDLSSATGDGLVEPLVVFFTIELFKLVEHLHINGFIHGDLKIDNCLVRLEDVPGAAWSTQYDPTGANGWAQQGVRLIDFGRAIDTTLFPEDQVYVGDWPTDARDCVEMREGRPWTFETDYFGLAGIVFCMLFKKYIDTAPITAPDGSTRYKLATPLKRYWNTPLWTRVFDVLLNPKLVRPDGSLPIVDELTILRDEMEHWLVQNSAKSGKSLKVMLKQIGQMA